MNSKPMIAIFALTLSTSLHAASGTIFASNCALKGTQSQCTSLIRWTTTGALQPELYAVVGNTTRKLISRSNGMINFSGITATRVKFQLKDGETLLSEKIIGAVPAHAPTSVIYLRNHADSSGATEVTSSLRTLFTNNSNVTTCFDGSRVNGERGVYKVAGSINITKSFCLKNAVILQRQRAPTILTSGDMIVSELNDPGLFVNPAAPISYPEDPAANPDEHSEILSFLGTRTLYIKTSAAVQLENVTVDRGDIAYAGSEGSTGIWIQGANPLVLKNVSVTGKGLGKGVLINAASNVSIEIMRIHDLEWAPYPGDRPLDFAHHRSVNYNHASIYLYDVNARKFVRNRIRENIIALQIMNSHNVDINELTVERIGATFPDVGFVAYQTDGFDLLESTDVVLRNSNINDTWEGIDFGYAGLDPAGALCVLSNVSFENSFSAGFKFRGAGNTRCHVINSRSTFQGYTGLIVGTPNKEILVHGFEAYNTGYYRLANGTLIKPWMTDAGVRTTANAGVLLSAQLGEAPTVTVEASVSDNRAMNDTSTMQPMLYGFQCEGNCEKAKVFNIDAYDFANGGDGARGFTNDGYPRITAPVITEQIANTAAAAGNVLKFTANYTGTQTSLKWYFKGQEIAHAGPILYVHVSEATIGEYYFRVSNGVSTVTSSRWTLSLR